jgi:predicted metal-dependent phosphoesterase TrpH
MRLAAAAGLCCVPAIEITAVAEAKDMHILGYFIDVTQPSLLSFLEDSRNDRLRRARGMCERLAELGAPVDFDRLLARAGGPNSGKAIARPVVARALMEAGHVESTQEAFDRFLADGAAAYVPRVGASPAEVIRIIRDAGGVASLAHPGPIARDHLIEPLARAGLTAVECFHSDHDEAATSKYLEYARRLGLGVTGGSDFHGPGTRRAELFGRVGLPQSHFDDLVARAGRPAGASA